MSLPHNYIASGRRIPDCMKNWSRLLVLTTDRYLQWFNWKGRDSDVLGSKGSRYIVATE